MMVEEEWIRWVNVARFFFKDGAFVFEKIVDGRWIVDEDLSASLNTAYRQYLSDVISVGVASSA